MVGRLARAAVWLSVAAGVAWIARAALKRYVDGPAIEPSRDAWPPPPARRPSVPAQSPAAQSPPAQTSPPASAGQSWVAPEPSGADCPTDFPVKAKHSSRLYHLPGMLAYERTHPDRCYASAEAAEADGFTRSKR